MTDWLVMYTQDGVAHWKLVRAANMIHARRLVEGEGDLVEIDLIEQPDEETLEMLRELV